MNLFPHVCECRDLDSPAHPLWPLPLHVRCTTWGVARWYSHVVIEGKKEGEQISEGHWPRIVPVLYEK